MIQKNLRSVSLSVLLMMVLAVFNAQAESLEYEFAESSRSIMRTGPDQTLMMLVQQLYPDKQEI